MTTTQRLLASDKKTTSTEGHEEDFAGNDAIAYSIPASRACPRLGGGKIRYMPHLLDTRDLRIKITLHYVWFQNKMEIDCFWRTEADELRNQTNESRSAEKRNGKADDFEDRPEASLGGRFPRN